MFHDEWVTYTSQWGAPSTEQSCLDMNSTCYNRGADVYYQVPQFWYNALVWASGDRECFDITDPTIVKSAPSAGSAAARSPVLRAVWFCGRASLGGRRQSCPVPQRERLTVGPPTPAALAGHSIEEGGTTDAHSAGASRQWQRQQQPLLRSCAAWSGSRRRACA